MQNHTHSSNGFFTLGILSLFWYLNENERCIHGYTKREGCESCRLEWVNQKNAIYATGLLYACFKEFFSFLFDTLFFLFIFGVLGAFALFILGIVIGFDAPVLLYVGIIITAILLFFVGKDAFSRIKFIYLRNKIYFNSNGKRQLVPTAKNISMFAGKKYVGKYPDVYYLKR